MPTDKQLTMVFDVSGQPNNVLFASSTIDITRDIIALYDAAASGRAAPSTGSKPLRLRHAVGEAARGIRTAAPAAPRRRRPLHRARSQ